MSRAYRDMKQGTIVVQAAGLTMAVFLGLTLFTFQSKIDFSFLVSLPARFGARVSVSVVVTPSKMFLLSSVLGGHHLPARLHVSSFFLSG